MRSGTFNKPEYYNKPEMFSGRQKRRQPLRLSNQELFVYYMGQDPFMGLFTNKVPAIKHTCEQRPSAKHKRSAVTAVGTVG